MQNNLDILRDTQTLKCAFCSGCERLQKGLGGVLTAAFIAYANF